MQLNFNVSFSDLYARDGLIKLDKIFLNYVELKDKYLFHSLIKIREDFSTLETRSLKIKTELMLIDQTINSELIISLSYLLDKFITKLFNIENEVYKLKKRHDEFTKIYKYRKLFIERFVLKKYSEISNINISFIVNKLSNLIAFPKITEKRLLEKIIFWLKNKKHYQEELELAAQYVAWKTKDKQFSILSSKTKKINYENLIPFSKKKIEEMDVIFSSKIKRRYGFDLTTEKISLNEALYNTHYCIFCHKQGKDSCSKGLQSLLDIKKVYDTTKVHKLDSKNILFKTNSINFKKSPLNIELHGCPLGQKISEMNFMKSEGYSIASLAIIMIDNPLCLATGYKICTDCMNSCIYYQKYKPVNIPLIETRILNDVMNLPYGFEIYALLTKWNPLNFRHPLPKKKTGKNILVVGLGPAGFSLAYHLLNDGHNVIAIDGLKIEPIFDTFEPIKDFKHEKLSERIVDGFGGVAEYGITSRWNKNYLKSIRLLLERQKKNFALYGGIRFGGTLTVNDAFNLGFDHIALALGSGNPKIIKIKNALARGVRMASDFLMLLQLGSAFKAKSITNLQIRMPIVVIGAGLTAIDTATEALAYYPIQVEKFFSRYKALVNEYGKKYVEKGWTDEEHEIMNEFILHAQLIDREKKLARKEKREAKILELVQSFGGVKVIYRKELKDSSGYRINSSEVQNALSEGVYFIENLKPIEIIVDKYKHAESIKTINIKSGKVQNIRARSIFIAVGTRPNTVITTEDKKHFKLNNNGYFIHLNSLGEEVDPIFSPKMENKDRILVYKHGNKTISFFGDLHPSYRGSVVKAIASAKNGYPIISELLKKNRNNSIPIQFSKSDLIKDQKKNPSNKKKKEIIYLDNIDIQTEKFFSKIKNQFTAQVLRVQYLTDKIVEILIKAPLAAKNFKPGQFFKLQNFQINNEKATSFSMEGIAVTGTEVNKKKGIISTVVLEIGGSTNLCKFFKEGEKVVLMGPTGSPSKIYKK